MSVSSNRYSSRKFIVVIVVAIIVVIGVGSIALYYHTISTPRQYNYLPIPEGAKLVVNKERPYIANSPPNSPSSPAYIYVLLFNVTGNFTLVGSWKSTQAVNVSIAPVPSYAGFLIPYQHGFNGTLDYKYTLPSQIPLGNYTVGLYFYGNAGTVVEVTNTIEVVRTS